LAVFEDFTSIHPLDDPKLPFGVLLLLARIIKSIIDKPVLFDRRFWRFPVCWVHFKITAFAAVG
jgi:hypothetical protein